MKSINNPLYIRDISIKIYLLKNFIYILFYFFKIDNNSKSILVEIKNKIYLVEKLKVKMLIDNDILMSKDFILDLLNKKPIIFNCNTKI